MDVFISGRLWDRHQLGAKIRYRSKMKIQGSVFIKKAKNTNKYCRGSVEKETSSDQGSTEATFKEGRCWSCPDQDGLIWKVEFPLHMLLAAPRNSALRSPSFAVCWLLNHSEAHGSFVKGRGEHYFIFPTASIPEQTTPGNYTLQP